MKATMKKVLLVAATITLMSGCATNLPEGHVYDPRDPYEAYNRSMFEFNTKVDEAVVKPVAQAYQSGVPQPIRTGVSNFFGNLSDLVSTVHHIFQAEGMKAGQSGGRVLINTTIGILGFLDPATEMGVLKTSKEDFGQTFGRWGAEPGAYIVLPFLGPSSGRDAVGTVLDIAADPIGPLLDMNTSGRVATWGLKITDTRAGLLEIEPMIDTLSFDRYLSVRDAYLARRQQQVGN
jgi:phospholipid-binding lipoprotein MlaA